MKTVITRSIVVFVLAASLTSLVSCASSTLIQSEPPGAKVHLNGEYKGETPYVHTDKHIIFTTTHVKLIKEGYEPYYGSFERSEEPNVGAIVGGFFVWPLWLWGLDYSASRTYELEPLWLQQGEATPAGTEKRPSKTEKLRELKQLLDEDILTQEEYDSEKKKILREDD